MDLYTQTVIVTMFTLALILIFPTPPHQQLKWDYKKADSKDIRKALDLINWEMLFEQKDINAQVAAFKKLFSGFQLTFQCCIMKNHMIKIYLL